jgi:hypothetical protein
VRNTTIRLDDYHDVMARSEFSCAATSHPMHQDASRTPFRLRLAAPVAALTSEERAGFAHLLERLTMHHAVVVVGHNLRVQLESAAPSCAAAIDFDQPYYGVLSAALESAGAAVALVLLPAAVGDVLLGSAVDLSWVPPSVAHRRRLSTGRALSFSQVLRRDALNLNWDASNNRPVQSSIPLGVAGFSCKDCYAYYNTVITATVRLCLLAYSSGTDNSFLGTFAVLWVGYK